jgi:capsular polysaccharide biosynthesis protein
MRRWILLAANLYPRAWRQRYGEEFQALLEDVKPGWRELADVMGGALKMQIAKGTTYLKLIAALAVAGMIVAAAASFAVPQRYVSSAALRIGGQADATRIEGIEAVLLSRWYMTKLITGPLDLYGEERRRMPLEDVILQAQRDIQIRPMAAPSPNGAQTLGIFFTYPDKEKAQAVVRELATQLVRQNSLVNGFREGSWRQAWPLEPMPPDQEVEILSMASLPQKPVGPNRFAFAALGLGAGLGLGLLTALVMRWPKSTLRIAGCAVAGGALALGLSLFLPKTYTSTAELRFDPPSSVPERLVRDVSGGPVAEHTQRLAQEVLSEDLAPSILKRDLYPEERARKPLKEVAGIMRRNIVFKPRSRPLEPKGGPGAFSISFSYPDPLKAKAGVDELLMRFMIRNLVDELARKATKSADARSAVDHGLGERLELLDPASLPAKPDSPNRLAIAAAGLALGLLLGALAPRLRRRNRTPEPAAA